MWTITEFNEQGPRALREALSSCCAATQWVNAVSRGVPYRDRDAVLVAADAAFANLDAAGLRQAVDAHPAIGASVAGEGTASRWSRGEQSGVRSADDGIRRRLQQINVDYQRKFGQVFLIRATGRDPDELLAEAQRRLGNDPAIEAGETARELRAIVRLRLRKLVVG